MNRSIVAQGYMSNGDAAKSDPFIGQVVRERYQIEKSLGEGAFGKVYLAWDVSLKRYVAFKTLHPEHAQQANLLARFRREAEQLAAVPDHTRIVVIYDLGELPEDGLFIAMEYVEGQTLQQMLTSPSSKTLSTPLPIFRSLILGRQIAEGLREAHKAGILHRDLKPGNIMVRQTTEGESVKLIDFGLAKSLNPQWAQLSEAGLRVGTLNYMAPESLERGQYSERTDLYAWGVVVYKMLTGTVPFQVSVSDTDRPTWHPEVPRLLREVQPAVPENIESIVMQTLEKDPVKRPVDMQAVITALRALDGIPPRVSIPEEQDSHAATVRLPSAQQSPQPLSDVDQAEAQIQQKVNSGEGQQVVVQEVPNSPSPSPTATSDANETRNRKQPIEKGWVSSRWIGISLGIIGIVIVWWMVQQLPTPLTPVTIPPQKSTASGDVHQTKSTSPPALRAELFYEVVRNGQSTAERVSEGQMLTQGQGFGMSVTIDCDCFLYVLNVDQQHAISWLYPSGLPSQPVPKGTQWIPEDPQHLRQGWAELDNNPGEEIVLLWASNHASTWLEKHWTRIETSKNAAPSERQALRIELVDYFEREQLAQRGTLQRLTFRHQ